MMKGQKGITLVALIITIIVMLILVGVTISVALNGGLFTKAGEARDKTKAEQVKEAIQLARADILANYYDGTISQESEISSKLNTSFEKLIKDYLPDELDKKISVNTFDSATGTYTVTISDVVGLSTETVNFDFWKSE